MGQPFVRKADRYADRRFKRYVRRRWRRNPKARWSQYGVVYTGGRGRRRLTTPMEISQSQSSAGSKRSAPSSLSLAVKRSKEMSVVVGRTEKKTHFEKLSFDGDPPETVDVGTLYEMQLFNVGQGAASGERLATKVKALSLDICGIIYGNNTSTASSYRFLVVADNKPVIGDRKQDFFRPQQNTNVPYNFDTTGDYAQIVEPVNPIR